MTLQGLEKLSYIGLDLFIFQNIALNDISSLASLTSIQRELTLLDNAALSSLNGLHNIERVESSISISGHPLLENLAGLAALNFVGESILIINNETLSTCDNNNLCAIFDAKTGFDISIRNNAVGCNSVSELQAVCNPVTPPVCPSTATINIESVGGDSCPSSLFLFQTDTTAVDYSWDFGDGSPLENSGDFQAFTFYNTPGLYTIQVFLSYENGCLDTAFTDLLIGDPTSTFTYTLDGNTINLLADDTDPVSYTHLTLPTIYSV